MQIDEAQRSTSTFDGSPHPLPIEYHAGDACGLLYRVQLTRARAFCEGLSVEPWPVLGAAMVGVYAWEYRETSIGPYAELGIGLLVRRRGAKPSLMRLALNTAAQAAQGMLVLSLPVTTELACSLGKSLWGYPKYVAEISTRFDAHSAHVRLGQELELELGGVRGVRHSLPIATFTELAGDLVRTHVDVRSRPILGTPRNGAVRLLGGDGPSARLVRALGLDALRPALAFHTREFRATLPLGEALGNARSAANSGSCK